MALQIDLLGTPRVRVDGGPLAVDTRKATALLAVLSLDGAQGRDPLVDLLWPELDPERGRAALRRTLSTLRAALGGRWLEADRSAVRLECDADAVDVARFRALARGENADHLGEAVALHRGELLAGFGLRDSARFDDWQRDRAAELRTELELALDRLVSELATAGRPEEAIPHAQRRLALDPLHEPAHRSLIRLYAASGHRAEAVRQYRECVRVLDRELGVRPLPETTELYDAVNEGAAVALPATTVQPAPVAAMTTPGRLPLVGRDRELAALRAAFAASEEAGRLAVIEGEAGVGKTRLADEFLAPIDTSAGLGLAVRAHEGESGIPFGLVASLLRAALEGGRDARLADVPSHWRAEAARLVPEIGVAGAKTPDGGPGAQQRLHEGLVQVLCALLGRAAVVLDDLQSADAASLAMLGYLVRRLGDRPLLLVAAWRPEEAGEQLGLLRRSATDTLRLSRLGPGEVAELATGAGVERHAGRLYEETDGLPLFVVEYLAALTADPDAGEQLPSGVRELLSARLDAVGETAGQLVAAAAVIGRSFDVETLRAASGRGEEETVAGLEELTRRGLLIEGEDGYAFSHDKLLEIAYQRTSLARRRLLHRRVAEALTTRRADAALVAHQLLAAGMDAEAADAFRAAGDRARALYASDEALEAYRSALALGHGEPAALHEAIGDLHTLRGEYRAAMAAYEAAAALAGDDAGVAVLEQKLGQLHDRRGDFELAERHLAEALRLGGESARVQADRSLVAHRRGEDEQAVRLAQGAMELAEAAGDEPAVAQAENILGMLTGDRSHLERAVALAERLGDRSVLVAALNNLALVCARDGETERSVELTQRAVRLCAEQGDRHREAALHNNLADLFHRSCDEEASMAHLKQSVAIFAEIGGEDGEMQPEVWKLVEW
jgi:DNA-binding SARP family transcriptional activator/predicted ATPase